MTPTAEQIIAARHAEATLAPEEWLATLAELAGYDADVEARRARAKQQFWSAFLGGIALVVLAVALAGPAGFGLLAVWLIAVFALGARRRRLAKSDLPDLLSDTILPLVALLREDIERGTPLHLALDVRPSVRPENLASRTPEYKKGVYHKVVDSFHVHPWLIGDLELADGSLVAFSATDYIRHRKQTKRNPRGKIKTKVKATVKTDLRVSVRVKNAVYAVEASAAPGMKVKPGESRTALRVRRERKLPSRVLGWGSKVMPGDGLAAGDLVDAMADAYRRAARP